MTIDWEGYKQKLIQAAIAGLDNAAPELTQAAEVQARAQLHGQTGATFAGIYAAVDGAGVGAAAIVAQAVAAVEERNPAHVHTEDVAPPPDGVVRLLASVPTDYIGLLEARPDRRFLSTTLDQEAPTIADAVNAAVGKVV